MNLLLLDLIGQTKNCSCLSIYCHALLCISAACAVMQCPFVCPSVRYVCVLYQNVWTYFQNFFTIGCPHHSSYQTLWQYSYRDSPNIECRWVWHKSRFSTIIWLHHVMSTVRPPSVIHTAALDRGKLVTLIDSKRRRLLFAARRTTKCLLQISCIQHITAVLQVWNVEKFW